MEKAKIEVVLPVTLEEWKRTAGMNMREAGSLLEEELRLFDRYLELHGMLDMNRLERQMVREYIGFKLANAEQ